MNVAHLAETIADARRSGKQTQIAMPQPALTILDAMDVQQAVFESFGSPSIGWKVGATNEAAQKGFGLDDAFYGPMAKAGLVDNGGSLEKTPCIGAVEPEYAFKMARDYPGDGETITVETATDAVASVHAAIEVIGRCLSHADFANGVGVTLDFGGNAAFIVGPEVSDWHQQDLANTAVVASVDEDVVHRGNGQPVMGDPINSLVWLAKKLAANGQSLKAGEWVSSGTCTPAIPAEAGKIVSAQFGDFGTVSVKFV